MTNYERIKAMSIEELAEVIVSCTNRPVACECDKPCMDCTLEWLREEV